MKKIVLLSLFVLSAIIATSQTYIQFYGTQSSYCWNAVPGGTFYLKLVGGNCTSYQYTWYNVSSNGCVSNEPISANTAYPSQTTTYCCENLDTGAKRYFTITVEPEFPISYNVGGGNCCANYANVTLSSSTSGYTFYLYKDGVSFSSLPGTGNPLIWYNCPQGTYTVKAYKNGCYKQMSGYAYIGHYCCKGAGDDKLEIMSDNDIKVYPNPNMGSFYIEANISGVYTLIDELGRKQKDIVFTGQERIELNGLKPGLYFIRDESGNYVSKISVTEP